MAHRIAFEAGYAVRAAALEPIATMPKTISSGCASFELLSLRGFTQRGHRWPARREQHRRITASLGQLLDAIRDALRCLRQPEAVEPLPTELTMGLCQSCDLSELLDHRCRKSNAVRDLCGARSLSSTQWRAPAMRRLNTPGSWGPGR